METPQLPLPFQLWLNWMLVVIILAPVLFVRHRQGRIALLGSVVLMVAQIPLMSAFGFSHLLALTHLLVWTPVVVYFCRELRAERISVRSVFGVWSVVMVASAIISLVFDVRDFGRWVLGDRGVVNPPPWSEKQIPWIMLVLIAAALGYAGNYVFGKRAVAA